MTAGWPSTAAGSLQLRTTARHARLPNGDWGARCSHPGLEATAGARTRRSSQIAQAQCQGLEGELGGDNQGVTALAAEDTASQLSSQPVTPGSLGPGRCLSFCRALTRDKCILTTSDTSASRLARGAHARPAEPREGRC